MPASVRSGPLVVQLAPNHGLTWTDQGLLHWRAAPRANANFD